MNAAIGVRRELDAHLAITRLAWRTRANQGSNLLTWLFLAAALVIPLVAFAATRQSEISFGFGAGVPLAGLALTWWLLLVSSVAEQNRQAARLIPGLGRRSVAVLVSCWAAIIVVLTLLSVLGGLAPSTAATAVALTLVLLGAYTASPGFALLFGLCSIVNLFLGKYLWPQLAPMFSDRVLAFLWPVVSLGLGYFAIRTILKGQPRKSGLAASAKKPVVVSDTGAPSSYANTLRRDCAAGRVNALLMHATGPLARAPSLKWFGIAAFIALVVVLAAPGLIDRHRVVLQAIIPVMMAALQAAIAPTMVQAVYKTRHEQALVRLAPRAPGAATLNASLAHSLLLEYGRCWLASTALALACLYFLGVPGATLLRVLAVFMMTLTWANLLLRDYASESGGNGSVSGRMLVMLCACVLTIAAQAEVFHPGPWLAVGCIALVLGLVIGRRRWNAMLAAPPAFPAARLP